MGLINKKLLLDQFRQYQPLSW